LRYYEMLFIVHPNYEQDQLDAIVNAVKKEITAKNGKILKVDNWGKRKLAYLINKQRYGSYVLMYFEADPASIKELYEWMEIQSQILHQLVIRLENEPDLSQESENPDAAYIRPDQPYEEKRHEGSGDKKNFAAEENEEESEETEVEA